ncbi:Hypothetical leucine rich repeat protein [Ectocarpus siliculosus]|uniref:Hypothetical leucine rich repeat protein n=1 Tax=Ectocarpus siliculosus TaxID=2880 RepID=D8LHC9_ECTSI|nr:Hypothetical leucine rich repeat protein [Ectocarpus siliculosus]|eukprot:CBN80246.1 Hypothetical leucine rich repeat protein [Ectocarpus siliculosus]
MGYRSILPELGALSKLQLLHLPWTSSKAAHRTTGIQPEISITDAMAQALQKHRPIPPELGILAALQELYVSSNQLPALQNLLLQDNQLSGQFGKRETLYLHRNKLSGEIPASLGQLSEL